MEIVNPPEKEFRVMMVKMIQYLRKRMEAPIEKIPKHMEAKNMLLNNKCITESMKEEIKHIQRPKK